MARQNYHSIEINNCRNINSVNGGSIKIARNCLNVFYGKNGTGKTTLCRVIKNIAGDESHPLSSLESFSYQESSDPALRPVVSSKGRIKELLVFDDAWIQDHCFAVSTIQKDAFELYVRDDSVRKLEKKRSEKIGMLRKALAQPEVSQVESTLQDLQKNLGKAKTSGGLAASSPISKAFSSGSPIEPIPSFLKPVVKGCSGIEKAAWLKWHKGYPALSNNELCPYCGNEDALRIEKCHQYDEDHSGDAVSQWEKIAAAYERHSHQLSRHYSALLGGIVKSSKAPDSSQLLELESLCKSIKTAANAIASIREALGRESNINADQLINELTIESAKLDSCSLFLKTKDGVQTSEGKALKWIHDSIERIKDTQAELDVICNDLIAQVKINITGHEDEINSFLEECGYRYKIEIACNILSSDAKILLKPKYNSVEITKPLEALSYGEQNALALMLFMHEAIKKPHGIYILDDPISSFDYDKRFGVLYALFSDKSSLFKENLCGKTVVVMTHDPLVISDLLGIQVPGVKTGGINGNYLSIDKNGKLTCTSLDKQALAPYTQQLYKDIQRSRNRPRIFGYVRIRQYCELLRHDAEEKKTKYAWTFSLLSDIVHGRSRQDTLEYHKWEEADERKVSMCENLIQQLTGWKVNFWEEIDFYSDCMDHLVDLYYNHKLTSEDKLLIIRLMLERDNALTSDSSIMKRFADEACHIGGSYLRQLDSETYDQVPFYVIDWCDKVAAKAKSKLEAKAPSQTDIFK